MEKVENTFRRDRGTFERGQMKAKIAQLEGKYYGTYIEVFDNEDNLLTTLEVWYMGDHEPSIRQLEEWGYTQEQWDKND